MSLNVQISPEQNCLWEKSLVPDCNTLAYCKGNKQIGQNLMYRKKRSLTVSETICSSKHIQ